MNSFILREEDYAIRIIVYLATVRRKVKIQEICSALFLSRPIVVKIMNRLKTGGFVDTKTGKEGGYTVSEKVFDSSVYDILVCMGFSSRVNTCLSNNDKCQLFPICKINRLFSNLQNDVEERLKQAKIKEFLFNSEELFFKFKSQQEV
ncbi:MAG: Rrf2 family transcriptional regulator [Deferribacterales bacterium]